MKLKCIPEDFVVDEKLNLPIQQSGKFALYKASKKSLTTDELVGHLAKWIRKPIKLFSFAGMKDRHGLTSQHISIKGDGPEQIETDKISAHRIGYVDNPLSPSYLQSNFFSIILRDLKEEQIAVIQRQKSSMLEFGIPNYYDDQRFRSQYSAKNAIAFYLFRQDFELALYYYVFEFAKKAKFIENDSLRFMKRNWGDWKKFEEIKIPADLNKAFNHLKKNPNDFQGSIAQLGRLDLRMMISAGYSFLWNEVLARLIRENVSTKLVAMKGAWQDYLFFMELDIKTKLDLDDFEITIPSRNRKNKIEESCQNIVKRLLEEFHLHVEHLKSSFVNRFYKGEFSRKALMHPGQFIMKDPAKDDMYPGRYKMQLEFSLPPGSYATMVIKRLMLEQ